MEKVLSILNSWLKETFPVFTWNDPYYYSNEDMALSGVISDAMRIEIDMCAEWDEPHNQPIDIKICILNNFVDENVSLNDNWSYFKFQITSISDPKFFNVLKEKIEKELRKSSLII